MGPASDLLQIRQRCAMVRQTCSNHPQGPVEKTLLANKGNKKKKKKEGAKGRTKRKNKTTDGCAEGGGRNAKVVCGVCMFLYVRLSTVHPPLCRVTLLRKLGKLGSSASHSPTCRTHKNRHQPSHKPPAELRRNVEPESIDGGRRDGSDGPGALEDRWAGRSRGSWPRPPLQAVSCERCKMLAWGQVCTRPRGGGDGMPALPPWSPTRFNRASQLGHANSQQPAGKVLG